MKLNRLQLQKIINESIFGRLKQALGYGDTFENCFNIGETELKNKLSNYAQKKIRSQGFSRSVGVVGRRGDSGDYLRLAINNLVDSVDMLINLSHTNEGEEYKIVYTQNSGDWVNIGGSFGATLAHLTIEAKEIDEEYSNVKVKFHRGDRFKLSGSKTSVNMDKILTGGIKLLKRKFITQDMRVSGITGTPVLRGDDFARDDLFTGDGNLGLAGVVSNSRLEEFCTGVSRLANEFVIAKVAFTIDIGLIGAQSSGASSYDKKNTAMEMVRLIDLKIYQAEENMRSFI